MGHTESVPVVAAPAEIAEDDHSRQRQDYIRRLGIRKDRQASGVNVPTIQFEAPEQSCQTSLHGFRRRGSSDMTSSRLSPYRPVSAEPLRQCSEDSSSCIQREATASTSAESDDSASSGDATDTSCAEKEKHLQDDFRTAFLRKLSYEKVWVPKTMRPPSHQTVIIFDWDDTLLCTSYLASLEQDYCNIPPSVLRNLQGIAKAAQQLLETSLAMGHHTFIITNAAPQWVEYSAAKYVPQLLPTLAKVRVISARGRHERQYPRDVAQWKIQAFLEVQRQLNSEVITNLISVGDSRFEMDATHIMGKEFDVALVKTIKFRENPCPEELLKQLELVAPKFERIVENAKHLRIALERKPQI